MEFTHLHVHTEYSLLDGAARVQDIVKQAKNLGMNALAITDHGSMFGTLAFYKACKQEGIKPIIGCEVYVALNSHKEKEKARNHLVLLAENQEGYQNLIKLVSKAYIDGFYIKPRIDKELLREHSKGIIALSACLAGRIPSMLLNGNYAAAKEEAMLMQDIMGHDNFFIEIQDHGLIEEKKVNTDLIRLARELDIPLVATNDVHYVNQSDYKAHDVLMAIQTGKRLSDPDRMVFESSEYYLKSAEEMNELFKAYPDAIENTNKIANRCNVEFEFGKYHLPEYHVEGQDKLEFLRELCVKGLNELYPNKDKDEHDRLVDRLEHELNVISSMGYVEYFLIVWDFINFAKGQKIMVGPGRGSAAGSLVSYCLKITTIDPIKYGLIFERFLNPERISMPDIDIDFCIERREEVIEYVKQKYGHENVSQIITFGTLKARAAIRDVGRVMDYPLQKTDVLAKTVPQALKMTIEKAWDINPELKKLCLEDSEANDVIEMAKKIEGMPRNASTHAAGVVISKKPISHYVPLYASDKGIATQFNKKEVEQLGLLKMDFLGLRNLTVIRNAIDLIEKRTGKHIDIDKIEYNDKKVFDLISSGNTKGVFQLESTGMMSFMKELKPNCFEDIIAGISLYRPGPMDSIPKYIQNKRNPENVSYITPELKDILDVTYGCMVYQEQVSATRFALR